MSNLGTNESIEGIAVIGMSGRFPGAKNLEQYWQNLRDGVESISSFSDQELKSSGAGSALLSNPAHVKAGGILEDIELFDASFFGFNPSEAEIIDPQQRIFLECAWEALENAGYDSEAYEGSIGVYAGVSMNTYLLNNVLPGGKKIGLQGITEPVEGYQTFLANDKDFMPTRVSYKLNLKGPSVAIQTACSTSLVAIHFACQSLRNYECDMALTGGVSTRVPQKAGYLYQEGIINSPDGHCRAFDAKAQGTVGGEGVGIVVLKRLADALADGDYIYAVIKGSAINNDGSSKVGYTAPSVDGQMEVIAMAQALAGIEADTVTYVETHGTGTPLGDPIEITALTQVFRGNTEKKGFCAIGSVKTNLGHADAAAGVAGLIKTVLALKHRMIPPSLQFEQPNPKIDFQNSPFYVNTMLSKWKTNDAPRRAGVSAFGIGGTNAHAVLEEAPAVKPSDSSRPWQLLLLSAKTDTALETATTNLAEHLKHHSEVNLADVAFTLQLGRRNFDYRRLVVCRDLEDALDALESLDPKRVVTAVQESNDRPVAFMFTGQGSQYVNMALELYQIESIFREQVDHCAELLIPYLGLDLRDVLYPREAQAAEATEKLNQTFISQPALFVIDYALARLWMEWGVLPQTMIGHSIGEYVAACLAGVFSLQEALSLAAARGLLMQELPGGAMLAVPLPENEVGPLLGRELYLAAINAPTRCVVSGPSEAVDRLERRLTEQGVSCRRLHTSHAFHSALMDPILDPFTNEVKKIQLSPPQIPFISCTTGTWISDAEATDPAYWVRHLRHAVRFSDGIQELMEEEDRILLEVGPGQTLSSLAKLQGKKAAGKIVLASTRHPKDSQSDIAVLLNTLGRLWLAGAGVNWPGFYVRERRHRVPLPTYPFEHQRFWIEPQESAYDVNADQGSLRKKPNLADWLYLPSWKRSGTPKLFGHRTLADQKLSWLVFIDECGVGSKIVKRLEQAGHDVTSVTIGEQFSSVSEGIYTINPQAHDNYNTLLKELRTLGKVPSRIIHLWSVTSNDDTPSGIAFLENSQDLGFYSLLFLARAIGKQRDIASQIDVITNNIQEVTGEEVLYPEKATVLGPAKVIPQEDANITCRSIDIVLPEPGSWPEEKLIDQLIEELVAKPSDSIVAYRGKHRWVQSFEAIQMDGAAKGTLRLREQGVYLITGALLEFGLVVAEYLARAVQAKLILTKHPSFPARDEWKQWLEAHDDQDRVSRKIRRMQTLEELGAEILVIGADVSNQDQMQAVVTQAYERFGHIHGVIHAAVGISGEKQFSPIVEISQAECEQHFRAKVHGLIVLEKVLQGRMLDFCVLTSSLSGVLGGLGFVAYSAANHFVDAMAHKHNQTNGVRWTSVNWDGWQVEEETEQDPTYGVEPEEMLSSEEAVEVFDCVLSMNGTTQVIISTSDLQTRADRWINPGLLREAEHAEKLKSSSLHPRRNLSTDYIAPKSELEQTIATIWQELMGIDQVGVHDNFFELGGDSLLATQLTSRLRDAFQVNIPLRSLLEAPSIAELAVRIEEILMKEISEMSDYEAQHQLEGLNLAE